MEDWDGINRRKERISDDDLEKIAQRAKRLVKEDFTLEVGKVAIRLVLYACGAGGLVLLAWLATNQKITL